MSKKVESKKKKKDLEMKAKQEKEYREYISTLSTKRNRLAKEAKDAGFESLTEYLIFLELDVVADLSLRFRIFH